MIPRAMTATVAYLTWLMGAVFPPVMAPRPIRRRCHVLDNHDLSKPCWEQVAKAKLPPKIEAMKHATNHNDGDRRILDLPVGLSAAFAAAVDASAVPPAIVLRPTCRRVRVVNNNVVSKHKKLKVSHICFSSTRPTTYETPVRQRCGSRCRFSTPLRNSVDIEHTMTMGTSWSRSPGTGKLVWQQGNMVNDLPTSSRIIPGTNSEDRGLFKLLLLF